jgi:hypothetical protein
MLSRKILDLSLVPIPGLRKTTGCFGFLSSDCTEISVDEADMNRFPYQYRFTLAHEAAHFVLHKDVVLQCHAENIAQWSEHLRNEALDDWTVMERQADEFARSLLVPAGPLREAVTPYIEQARAHKIDLRDLGRDARKRIGIMLEPVFETPSHDIIMRLEDEDLP